MAKKSKAVAPVDHGHPLPEHSHELLLHEHSLEQHDHKHDHGSYSVKGHEHEHAHEHQHEHSHPKTAEIVRALLGVFGVGQINSAQVQGIEEVKRLLGDPAMLCAHRNAVYELDDVLICQDCRETITPEPEAARAHSR